MPSPIPVPILDHMLSILRPREEEIAAWFEEQRREAAPFFYTSVDLRHAGFKIAPVDTNLFPAGFNNLSPAAVERAVARVKYFLQNNHPRVKRILLIPENHTRNLHYLTNLDVLAGILRSAGAEVKIGSMATPAGQVQELTASNGALIQEFPLQREEKILRTEDGFTPDLIVVNNDFTSGAPKILCGLSQPVVPPPGMGWYRRMKSVHFKAYDVLAGQFGERFGIDPWLISTFSQRCGVIDFSDARGAECVATNAEKVLHAVRRKYQEYGINREPSVFVKADSGTYGMGIITVRSGEELLSLNKKARGKMKVIKEGAKNTEVIIQEGVPSIDRVEGKVAEPMLYLIDGEAVGGAYRVHPEKGESENLNAPGMVFTGMCDEAEGEKQKEKVKVAQCNFKVFGLVAKLAAYAAAHENYEPNYMI